MIIVLIFIGLFVLFGALCIVGICREWDPDGGLGGAIFLALVGLVGSAITGIWCITVNLPLSVENERYKLQETLKLYENEHQILLSFHTVHEGTSTEFTSDITLETISTTQYYARVDKYNNSLFKFKTDTMSHKFRRANPWTSWFESEAWDAITREMLDNLTYTTGK